MRPIRSAASRGALALSLTTLSLAVPGAAFAQITCDAPLVTELTAGRADNFAPPPPTEPASPSSEFSAFLGGPAPVFDQTEANRRFGHTFTGLPTGIIGATLTIKLRALLPSPTAGSTNDGLLLEFSPGPVFAWSTRLDAWTGLIWRAPDQVERTLDLADLPPSGAGVANILAALADGDLDVFVQDDTAVDFMTLRVTHCPPPPPCATPPRGLVGWWPLDETTPGTAADLAARRDGAHLNTPTPVPGIVGGALSFSGTEEVQVPDDGSLDFGASPDGDFSIDFWLRTTDTRGLTSVIEKRENPVSTPRGYEVFLAEGKLALQLAEGGPDLLCDPVSAGGCTNYFTDQNLADGEWHLVAITVDRDQPDGISWYVDGVEVDTRRDPTLRGDSLANGAPLRIAAQAVTRSPFVGALDEIEVFSRVLLPHEIAAIFAAGASGKCKPTIHEPRDNSMCPTDLKLTAHPEICNNSSELQSFALRFAAPAPNCVFGPPSFTLLDAQPLLVPPRSCRTVTVQVARPPSFETGSVRCFEITANNLTTGQVTTHRTRVWGNLPCAKPKKTGGYLATVDDPTSVTFVVRNPSGSPVVLPYAIEAMPAETGGVEVSLDGGAPGNSVTGQVTVPAGGTVEVAVEAQLLEFQPFAFQDVLLLDSRNDAVLAAAGLRSFAPGCTPGPTALCLNGGRFQVSVAWKDFAGNTGLGQAVPLTGDTGYFWFFGPTNVELVLKVLDGRPLNDHFWVFYGALSTVEYVITVTDTETGNSRTFVNPSGNLASVADTEALPGSVAAGASAEARVAPGSDTLPRFEPVGTCTGTATALCLQGGRFRVEVNWKDFAGNTGAGQAVPLTSDTGYFWFFGPDNVELILKVLDGTPLNQHWWVFYGALSSVEYQVTVTDTVTGNTKTYFNPSGNLGSVADTSALPE